MLCSYDAIGMPLLCADFLSMESCQFNELNEFLNVRRKTKGHSRSPLIGHPIASKSRAEGARSCPEVETADLFWLESPMGCTLRETSSKNHVWDGQKGAISRRRTPHSLTLTQARRNQLDWRKRVQPQIQPRVSKSIYPQRYRVTYCGENQRGHWVDSCDTKRSTSRPAEKIPDLSFCLNRKSTASFRAPGLWTALRERNLSWAQRRRRCTSLCRVRNHEHPWQFMWDTTAVLSVPTITWQLIKIRRKCTRARKMACSSRLFMCHKRNSHIQTPPCPNQLGRQGCKSRGDEGPAPPPHLRVVPPKNIFTNHSVYCK